MRDGHPFLAPLPPGPPGQSTRGRSLADQRPQGPGGQGGGGPGRLTRRSPLRRGSWGRGVGGMGLRVF